jgi:hypothetical protein
MPRLADFDLIVDNCGESSCPSEAAPHIFLSRTELEKAIGVISA